jgi:hypothetical protein
MLLLDEYEVKFEQRLKDFLRQKGSLTTTELYELFAPMPSATVAWHLHRCVENGFVKRIGAGGGRGIYQLSDIMLDERRSLDNLSAQKREVYEFLCYLGYDFYLSGFDSLGDVTIQDKDDHPMIICTGKKNLDTISLELTRKFTFALAQDNRIEKKDIKDNMQKYKFYVLEGRNFDLQMGHFAVPEKSFVDLYFAITRLHYPFEVEKLPYILDLIKPNGRRFHFATKDRKVAAELDFLLNYDRAFLLAFADYIART